MLNKKVKEDTMTGESWYRRNPLMFWLFIVFAVLNIIDLVLALKTPLTGESNPIWLLTKSITALIVFKIAFIILTAYIAMTTKWPKPFY